jgi:antitoxin MazE
MKAKIQRWGNSLAVRIPMSLARALGLHDQSAVALRLDEGSIVIEPLRPTPTLEELLAGVTPQNRHRDLEWRPAGGLEVEG